MNLALAPDGPGYLDADPFALTRERRAQAAERRKAEFTARYGETIRARMSERDVERYMAWERAGRRPSPGEPVTSRAQMLRQRRLRRALRSKKRRTVIAALQGFRCYLCGEEFADVALATEEHVVPRALGGKTRENILMACQPCNVEKGHREPRPCEVIYLRAVNFALANGPPEPRVRVVRAPAREPVVTPQPAPITRPIRWRRPTILARLTRFFRRIAA